MGKTPRHWHGGLLGVLALVAGCAPEPPFVWERHLGGLWCYRTATRRRRRANGIP